MLSFRNAALLAFLGLAKVAMSTPVELGRAAEAENLSPLIGVGPPPITYKLTCSSPIQTASCAEDGYSCTSTGGLRKPNPTVEGCEPDTAGQNGCQCDIVN